MTVFITKKKKKHGIFILQDGGLGTVRLYYKKTQLSLLVLAQASAIFMVSTSHMCTRPWVRIPAGAEFSNNIFYY